jgi:flagellin
VIVALDSQESGLAKVDDAIAKISAFRGSIRATKNRLTRALNTLNVSIESLTAAFANIKNGNIAKEITELTKK